MAYPMLCSNAKICNTWPTYQITDTLQALTLLPWWFQIDLRFQGCYRCGLSFVCISYARLAVFIACQVGVHQVVQGTF